MTWSPSRNSAFRRVSESPADASSADVGVEFLGSQENGMVLVHPTTNDSHLLVLCHELNRLMQLPAVTNDFGKWIGDPEKDYSARNIQGGRIEIFLENAVGKGSNAFDAIIGERLPGGAKDKILNYARSQAQRDPRLGDMEYGNFSLICTYGPVDAQAPHLDSLKPNFQFGLILSDNAPGTLFYESAVDVSDVNALVEHWKNVDTILGSPYKRATAMPPALVQAMERDASVLLLLSHFGRVLLPERSVYDRMRHKEKLATGSLLSLPGSVVHAGPASTDFRAVIFFSGWPNGSEVAPYDPDVQYTSVLLMAHFVSLLWQAEGVGYPERLYLLQRLAQYTETSMVKEVYRHFGPGPLANFIGNIEEQTYKKYASREDYIEQIARTKDMGAGLGGGPTEEQPFAEGDYKKRSIAGMLTLWEGEEFLVEVLQRKADGQIILRYPNNEDGKPDELEGNLPEDNFQLVMKKRSQQNLFDGTNGTLYDNDGNKIHVYMGRKS
ncbi:expressed unknown protein [Seminavis robusta]|uniref:Uncharacterized protein n=1 Tax=Seminavis robusta TaxID=568900 RepID=A0A9N8ESW6_9STRA|nr:expressed unknown protein [Seminavis robusta]|eukprot:Sro1496_g277540.1 n/a (496) ;mRNA; r:20616-22190